MKYIKGYNNYINESWLKGGKHLLYHSTNYLFYILDDDVLKGAEKADEIPIRKSWNRGRSISFSRVPFYRVDRLNAFTIVLNYDILLKNGYRAYPSNEAPFSKVEYLTRHPHHNIPNIRHSKADKAKVDIESEYEERIYKDIKNLGKYIIYIDIYTDTFLKHYHTNLLIVLKKYLEKYPHIELRLRHDKFEYKKDKGYYNPFVTYKKPEIITYDELVEWIQKND